jgi:hypothetical protein
MHMPAGGVVIREGDPADQFFVLLSGTIALTRKVGQDEVETTRTEQRGVYMGATQSYLRDDGVPRKYMATCARSTTADFFVLSAERLQPHDARVVPDGDPPARGPDHGHAQHGRGDQRAAAADRARRALGRPHARAEQPAAAASRAAASLRQRVAGMRHKLGMLAAGKVPPTGSRRSSSCRRT